MDLQIAIKTHAEWKIRLRAAIQKKEQLDVIMISADNQCPLGRWLHHEAKRKHAQLPSYLACVFKHRDFHQCVGGIAQLVNEERYVEAEELLAGNEYVGRSKALRTAIQAFRKEVVVRDAS